MPIDIKSPSVRPVTSKARGICRYYTTPNGCFAGESCKFLHGRPKAGEQPLLTPYDKSKRCRYFDNGYCKRGENCWFLHKADRPKHVQAEEDDDDECCSICFETPSTYGLLGGCGHIFCVTCIRQWRDPQNKPGEVVESGNTKKCPMCRTPSRFITPSSKFLKDGTEEKKKITAAYRESMARVPCRYFQRSLAVNSKKPTCPYGKDCFYQHLNADGTPFAFTDGVDVCMKKYGRPGRPDIAFDFLPFDVIDWTDVSYDIGDTTIVHEFPSPFSASHPSSSGPHGAHADGPPSQHQHNHNRGTNYDLVDIVRRLREVGQSLEMLSGPPIGHGDGAEGDRDEDEGQEDEVMEWLESLADRVLASAALQSTAPPEPITTDSSNDAFPQVIEFLSSFDNNAGDADERASETSDMPPLESVSSSEDENSDADVGEADDRSGDVESASASAHPSEEPLPVARSITLGTAAAAAAAETPPQVDGGSIDGSNVPDVEVKLPSQEDTPAPPEAQTDATITTTTSANNLTSPPPPMTTVRGSKNGRASDAFTTDGRGRVISVGDTPQVVPQASSIDDETRRDTARPESSATSPIAADPERVGRGILEWIGSFL